MHFLDCVVQYKINRFNSRTSHRYRNLESSPQLKQYVNTAYLPNDPKSALYESKYLTSNSIMAEVQPVCSVFKNQTFSKFVSWCTSQKLQFFDVGPKRPRDDSGRTPIRGIFVLKDDFKEDLLNDIVNLPQRYQQYMSNLKEGGYHVLGYCRKSKTTGEDSNVTKLLQSMVDGLRTRSLVEKVYVSVSCNSKTPIRRRDLKKNNIIDSLSDVTGDAQDLIRDLPEGDKVCLAIIDSAGLTTNMEDLELLMSENLNLKKIIIDTIMHDNQVHVLECEDEIIERKSLFKFDGRENLFHRSKMLPAPNPAI